jgi:hypothetical protein
MPHCRASAGNCEARIGRDSLAQQVHVGKCVAVFRTKACRHASQILYQWDAIAFPDVDEKLMCRASFHA